MVKVVLALALNLRSELWSDPTISDVPQVTRLITGVLILLDSIVSIAEVRTTIT